VLKKGQIKFTEKAAEIAKVYFKKKKVEDFLIAIEEGAQKPPEYKEFYKILLGERQDVTSKCKVYTKDIVITKKLFEVSLMKEGRLSTLFFLDKGCLLYIAKAHESKYETIKHLDAKWPMAAVNENDNDAMIKFIALMRTKAVDLSDLILEVNNKSGGED
jgi:hypothetical protein